MKVVLTLIFAMLLFAPLGFTQEEMAAGDGFFSFSALHSGSNEPILTHTSLGGVATLGWNVNQNIGIEAEFGGYHNGFVNAYHNNTNSQTFLFGPRLSYSRLRTVDPYVHVLLGGIHTATSAFGVMDASGRHTVSQNGFTLAVGGGVDIKINKYVSFRPAQIDYMPTFLGNIGPNGLTNNSFRNNVRFCIGFMFQDYESW